MILAIFLSTDPSVNDALGFVPTGYIDGTNLVFIFSVAFGLSVDYEVFLLSRMLEEYARTGDVVESMLMSIQATGSIITSAAVMLSVTCFAFIVTKLYFLKILGVGIAIAVVLDATIVRMIFVPSVIKLCGNWNMYCPEWLGQIVDAVGLQEKEPADDASAGEPLLVGDNNEF